MVDDFFEAKLQAVLDHWFLDDCVERFTMPLSAELSRKVPSRLSRGMRLGSSRARSTAFFYGRDIQITGNALIGGHDELLVVRGHRKTRGIWKTL